MFYGAAGPCIKHMVKMMKKRATSEVLAPASVLEPKGRDQAHSMQTHISHVALAAIASPDAPWGFLSNYVQSIMPFTIDHIHACVRAQCL
jgi:hypothetical protein